MKLLCDGSTKDNTWGVGVSSACETENWDIGGLASDIPILQEENGLIDVSVAETLCIIFGLIIGSWVGHEEKTLVIVNDRMTMLASFTKQKQVRKTLYIAMRAMEQIINECTNYYASIEFVHKKKAKYMKKWRPDKLAEKSYMRQWESKNESDIRFLTILNSKLQDVLMGESLKQSMMPVCTFRLVQQCAFKWNTMDVTSQNHIMAIMMVHGTKWTPGFDNTLYLALKRSAESRNTERSYSSQTWD